MSNVIICKDVIVSIIEDLRTIVFPEYFDCNLYTDEYINKLTKIIENKLKSQIVLAFSMAKIDGNAENISKEFVNKISSVKDLLYKDLHFFYQGDPSARDYNEIIISYPGLFAILIHRFAHVLYQLNVPYIPRIMSEYAHEKTGIDIHPGARIGENFFIDHGTGIVIGETTIIGNNVKLYQGVTLGALSLKSGQLLKGTKRHPTIGNEVTIYAGASILGGDTVIGDNVTIGSNAFIMESIPSNSIVKLDKVKLEIASKMKHK